MSDPAALILAWKFASGVTSVQDFTYEGDLSAMVREIAAAIDVVDGGAALWRGVAADHQREVWRLEQVVRDRDARIEELDRLNQYALERLTPMKEAAR